MKSGLCLIYTSLLTVSLISSCCALFLIVDSEALHAETDPNDQVDLSGLHNISQKVNDQDDANDGSPPLPENKKDTAKIKKYADVSEKEKMTFADTLSLNSVTTDGLPVTGQPPIFISLGDTAKLDLKNPDELLLTNDSESRKENDTKSFVLVDKADAKDKPTDSKNETTKTLVVQAKSMHDRKPEDELPIVSSIEIPTTESQKETNAIENIPVKPATPQEDIPSFSEWAQKQLAEAEKKDVVLNHSSQPSHSNTNISSKSTKSTKVRSKNYASPACGAKIVAVNPEAGSATSILSPNRDEYMLNTCNSRIWFVVELCEAVQAQKIEIANFELFSSTPKDFVVYSSDRFPTRDWTSVGQFTAKDMRDVQSFDLYPHVFGKFIKVELLSHYGSEHYCPVSLFKVYGTSEFEVLEKESSQHTAHIDDDDDDDIIDVPDLPSVENEQSKNLFGSARDAVMSIVKKAAQVLGKGEASKNMTSVQNDTSVDKMYKRCCSPSHIIVCDNCSDALYHEVYELISCNAEKLTTLLRQTFLNDTLKCTGICQPFGLDFKSTKTIEFSDERMAYIKAMFPQKYLAALCNILAVKEKKVVLNSSFETESNYSSNGIVDVPQQHIINGANTTDKEIKLEVMTNKTELPEEKVSEVIKSIEVPIEKESTNTTTPLAIADQEKFKPPDVEKPQIEVTPKSEEQDTKMQGTEEIVKMTESELKDAQPKAESTVEKPKDSDNTMEETTEQMTIENYSFISELDQMAVDPTPGSQVNQNQALFQKDLVFVGLFNRVKTLERNMSLSGQYLEELSRRYKKQVEEMQKTFEKTILQMTEERRKSNEREQKYLEQINTVQEQLAQMTSKLTILMEERDSWFGNVTFFRLILIHLLIAVAIFYYYFYKRPQTAPVTIQLSKKAKKKQDKLRRKSVEGVSGHETPTEKQRRPSEEALHIAREIAEEHNDDDFDGDWQIARKNRKRKTSLIHRNIETDKAIFVRQDTIGELQEHPIPLDEEEFMAPVSEPTEFIKEDKKKAVPIINGSIFSSLKKTRRLSSPAFLRTLSRQSSRSNPSPVVKILEPSFNGQPKKKTASDSPTGSLWSESTDISQNVPNDSESARKRKSLKSLFKKVF